MVHSVPSCFSETRWEFADPAGVSQAAIKTWGEALEMDKTNKAFNSKLYCNRAVALAKV